MYDLEMLNLLSHIVSQLNSIYFVQYLFQLNIDINISFSWSLPLSFVLTVSVDDAVVDVREGEATGGAEVSSVTTDVGINLQCITLTDQLVPDFILTVLSVHTRPESPACSMRLARLSPSILPWLSRK